MSGEALLVSQRRLPVSGRAGLVGRDAALAVRGRVLTGGTLQRGFYAVRGTAERLPEPGGRSHAEPEV